MPPLYGDDALVTTPYGLGKVLSPGLRTPGGEAVLPAEISLASWTLAGGKSPSLFTHDGSFPAHVPPLAAGSKVATPYGKGVITAYHPSKITVTLSSWTLANSSPVLCYLHPDQVAPDVPGTDPLKKPFRALSGYEKIDFAFTKRDAAKAALQLKDTAAANLFFEQALFCLQQVENEDLKVNLYRARLLECMIACLNNSALCCLTLREWQKAADGSRQAMMLVDALDRKRGGEIVKVMGEKLGVDEGRLFVDWRCKAICSHARALSELGEFDGAIAVLKRGAEICAEALAADAADAAATSSDAKIKKLLATYKQHKKRVGEKEKKAAMKMFGGGKKPASPARKAAGEQGGEEKKEAAPADARPAAPAPVKQREAAAPPPPPPVPKKEPEGGGGGGDEPEPWYSEHAEAMILVAGIAGVVGLGAMLWGRKK
ncbi:hypothetical protein TeGR_g1962 [Tetraparma gracilis]|uniref:Peptidylprolyl isomerase n=1 Tax=Tetraparma gracilis TaxID=2962635 RepID=A0ABQ6MNQ8_9STRA|nr:hypothetical protein TeGR_g1962 [Tetraparma gracilis]